MLPQDIHQRTSDDYSIGHLANCSGLLRSGNAESNGNRQRSGRSNPANGLLEVHREGASGASHTEARDEIDEALSIVDRPLQSVRPGRGSYETNEIDTTPLYRRLEGRISTGGKIGENEPRYVELFRVMQEAIDPIL